MLSRLLAGSLPQTIDKSYCITHQYCNDQALKILQANGFLQEYKFLNSFYRQIQSGVIWADYNWQNVRHFLNPNSKRGLWCFSNAVIEYSTHFKKAGQYLQWGQLGKAAFYLGAAAHLVQDMCVPHHAKCNLFDGHKKYEAWVEKRLNTFSCSKSCINPFVSSSNIMFDNAATALDFYSYVTAEAGDDKYRQATEILLPLACVSTVNLFLYFINYADTALGVIVQPAYAHLA